MRGVNVAAGTIELSQPLFAAAGTRTFTFERYRYLLDFMGFDNLSRIEMREIEFNGLGIASCVMLPRVGLALRFDQCVFNRPRDRGITSIGGGLSGDDGGYLPVHVERTEPAGAAAHDHRAECECQ